MACTQTCVYLLHTQPPTHPTAHPNLFNLWLEQHFSFFLFLHYYYLHKTPPTFDYINGNHFFLSDISVRLFISPPSPQKYPSFCRLYSFIMPFPCLFISFLFYYFYFNHSATNRTVTTTVDPLPGRTKAICVCMCALSSCFLLTSFWDFTCFENGVTGYCQVTG